MRKQWLLFLTAYVVLIALPASAQRTTGTIRGTIVDQSQGLIPGATVTVKAEGTGFTRTTTTNTSGLYTVSDLPVGTYRVDVEMQGFKAAARTKIVLNVSDTREVNFTLDTGAISEVVSVEANALAVKTSGGEVAGLINGEQVRELPLNGRNFLQLATLMPGVSAPDFLNVKDKGLLGGSDLSVSGSSVTSNLWTVDGANNNDVGSNRTILVYPSVDAIEEFKIERNSYGAEYGQSAGAQINIVTRSGTNEFHGSAFYFGRRDALNSANYFLEKAGQPKDKLKRNDFGWTLGGPIIKDKLHFFASEEWNREQRGTVRSALVPTLAERSGDFSQPVVNSAGTQCSSPTPIDPLTGKPFPGNKIPANRLSPGGLLFLQLYPAPNITTPNGNCNNWVASLNSPINWRQENVRLDWTMNDRTRMMVRYTQDAWTNNAPNLNSNLWGDDPFPAVDSNWDQPGKSFVVQLNRNIGSQAVNTLEFSYSANKITVLRGGTDPGLNDQITAAIPSVYPQSLKSGGADLGHPVFWGAQGYGQALWNEAPFHNNQDLFVLKDDYSAVFGKHFVKVGAIGSFNKKNEDFEGNGSGENSAFWGTGEGLNGWGSGTGNVMADFLLKDMTFGFSELSAQHQVPQRWKDLEFYAADSWKVSPRVTVDYGVRYSRFFNPYAADNRIGSFDPAHFDPALGNDPCNGMLFPPGTNPCQAVGFKGGSTGPNRSLTPENTHMIAPRVGLAWDVSGNGKTAIRVGLGQFYLRERLSPGLNIGNNPPFAKTTSGLRTLDTNADPCGCFGVGFGAPNAGREQADKNPYSWQWNLTFEHELLRNTTLEVSYVGNQGKNLLKASDINQVRSGDANGNGIDDRLEYARSNPADGSLRPFGVFGDHRITFWDHSGHSMYHSLQSQLVSRFGRGSQFQASYTLSRVRANDPLDNSSGSLANQVATLDLNNPELDYGLANTDRRHIANASLVLVLPTLEKSGSFARNVFGDWEIATIVAAASGTPITVFTGSIPGLNGGPSGTGYTDNQRPNLVASQPCSGSGSKEQILNPAAFTLNGFKLGTDGTSGRGVCAGPGFFEVDLSLYKNVKLSNRVKAQLRFEVFNVFNHVNFVGASSGSSGVNNTLNPISATFDGPIASATTITSAQIPADFGKATQAKDPRQAQFGIKLIF